MTIILACASQKGGVGKTTTAVNLAAAWADAGREVLLIDLDPQASATQALGFDVSRPYPHLGTALDSLLRGADAGAPVVPGRPALLPAHIAMAALETELALLQRRRETVLRRLLAPLLPAYDLLLLDCPPALGWLTINALVAATAVLVPTKLDYLSMAGLGDLWDQLLWIRADHNPGLRAAGLLPTQRDERIKHQRGQIGPLATFAAAQGVRVLAPIPTSAQAGEAAGAGTPLVRYRPADPAAVAYRRLAATLEDTADAD